MQDTGPPIQDTGYDIRNKGNPSLETIESGEPVTPVILEDPGNNNPFGFIHYINSSTDESTDHMIVEDEDIITLVLPGSQSPGVEEEEEYIPYSDENMLFLLPRSLLRSTSELSSRLPSEPGDNILFNPLREKPTHWTDEYESNYWGVHELHPGPENNQGNWGKRLPRQEGWSVSCDQQRVASAGYYPEPIYAKIKHSRSVPSISNKQKTQENIVDSDSSDRDTESPPNWISCFTSPKSRRKVKKNSTNSSTSTNLSASRKQISPIRFIDETPSDSSIDNLYCSPRLVDYEEFSQPEMFPRSRSSKYQTVKSIKRKSRSLSRSRLSRDRTGLETSQQQYGDHSRTRQTPDSVKERLRHTPDSAFDGSNHNKEINQTKFNRDSDLNTSKLTPNNDINRTLQGKGNNIRTEQFRNSDINRSRLTFNNDLNMIKNTNIIDQNKKQDENPQETIRSRVTAEIHHYQPPPYQSPPAVRCTCDSRRSSDSGLADVSSHAEICPFSPLSKGSLQSVTSIHQYPSSPRLSRFSSRGIYSATSSRIQVHQETHNTQFSSEPGKTIYSPLHPGSSRSLNQFSSSSSPQAQPTRCSCGQEQEYQAFYQPQTSSSFNNNNRISGSPRTQKKLQFSGPIPSQHSVSLDDLGYSLPRYSQSDQALSCIDLHTQTWSTKSEPEPDVINPRPKFYTEHTMLSTNEPTWSRTKVNYKSGVYAHWWMNTSLQPIREEGLEPCNPTQL